MAAYYAQPFFDIVHVVDCWCVVLCFGLGPRSMFLVPLFFVCLPNPMHASFSKSKASFIMQGFLDHLRHIPFLFLPVSDLRGLRAYPATATDSSGLVAALKTIAMGDTNACEIAQESHLALAYESGLLQPDTFLSPAALPPAAM